MLDTLENVIPSMNKLNEIDKKLDDNFNKVNGYIKMLLEVSKLSIPLK